MSTKWLGIGRGAGLLKPQFEESLIVRARDDLDRQCWMVFWIVFGVVCTRDCRGLAKCRCPPLLTCPILRIGCILPLHTCMYLAVELAGPDMVHWPLSD